MDGVFNKIISIDLTNKSYHIINIEDKIYEKFLGGRGLGVKLFTDRVPPETDPLSPENKMIFTTGPVTGTSVSTSGRMSLVTMAATFPENSLFG